MKTYDELQEENAALRAAVETLRKAIIIYDDCDTASQSKAACRDMIAKAKLTPKQCLNEIRAEAVTKFLHVLEHAPSSPVSAMVALGISQWWERFQNAERVKAGEA